MRLFLHAGTPRSLSPDAASSASGFLLLAVNPAKRSHRGAETSDKSNPATFATAPSALQAEGGVVLVFGLPIGAQAAGLSIVLQGTSGPHKHQLESALHCALRGTHFDDHLGDRRHLAFD